MCHDPIFLSPLDTVNFTIPPATNIFLGTFNEQSIKIEDSNESRLHPRAIKTGLNAEKNDVPQTRRKNQDVQLNRHRNT